MFRTQQTQCEYWFKYGQDPERVSRPGRCNSHMGGTAVDIGIVGLDTGGGNRHIRNENTKLLYDIMISAGWIRYCGEQWHFQYGDSQSVPCPGKGGHCTDYENGKVFQAPGCKD
jgi:D-alanyl-D-alanine dipeptidase